MCERGRPPGSRAAALRRARSPLLRIASVLAGIALAAAGSCALVHAKDPAAPPATRGPHDATSRRSFADVAHWTAVFDDPARDAWQKPREVVEHLALRPGMRVADLGAGTGYFIRSLSAAVGDDGAVLAVDTEPNLVAHLRERAEKENTHNVTPVLASFDNPRLPAAAVDVILIVDTFHHIDDRLTYFRKLKRALTPAGRVVIIDWQKRELPVGPPLDHKLARDHVVEEMTRCGYTLVEEPDLLPYQYFLIFRAR